MLVQESVPGARLSVSGEQEAPKPGRLGPDRGDLDRPAGAGGGGQEQGHGPGEESGVQVNHSIQCLRSKPGPVSLEKIIDMAINAEYESTRDVPAALIVLNDREQSK